MAVRSGTSKKETNCKDLALATSSRLAHGKVFYGFSLRKKVVEDVLGAELS